MSESFAELFEQSQIETKMRGARKPLKYVGQESKFFDKNCLGLPFFFEFSLISIFVKNLCGSIIK